MVSLIYKEKKSTNEVRGGEPFFLQDHLDMYNIIRGPQKRELSMLGQTFNYLTLNVMTGTTSFGEASDVN